MSLQKSQRGVTLLEIMLVLAIAASIIVMGMRLIGQFQFQANEQKLAGNINQIFQAMNGFYYANCRQAMDINSNPQSSGKLDPVVTDTSNVIKPTIVLGVQADLINSGFIPVKEWRPINPLLDNSQTDNTYFVQFNRVIENSNDPVMAVSACTGSDNPPSCNRVDGETINSDNLPSGQSHVATWVVQVAVKLSASFTAAQWTQIKNDLSAACISKSAGANAGIIPCTDSPTPDGYLVWTRMPGAYNPNISSVYWASTQYVTQFNRQYTNDSMANLSGVKNETLNPATGKSWYNSLNYLCGG